jgi:hypothetical protein
MACIPKANAIFKNSYIHYTPLGRQLKADVYDVMLKIT